MAFQYAAKVICGLNQKDGVLAVGTYDTVINIHNPNKEKQSFKFKLAQAGEAKDGAISAFKDGSVGPDGAQFFGCADIHKIFNIPATTLIDGFFVIESSKSLDVVAVYTTNDATGKGVPAIAVERVFERTV